MQEIIPGHKFDDTHETVHHSDQHCVNGSMFDHPNTKTYEMLIGLESDKRLIEEQRIGAGGEEADEENLDEYDENELDTDTNHLWDDKIEGDDHDEVEDQDDVDGVGIGDDWDGEEDEEQQDKEESEHGEL